MAQWLACQAREPVNLDRFPGAHLFSVCFFFFFFSIQMLNCYKLVKWHYHNDRNGNFETFYIELCMKPMGVGLNLALLKENKFGDPRFLFFFSERYYNSP